ncbi:MAG TPA: flagellar hook-length control protein FliK [Candidatus Desulfofervidus auxilii]|uniref:Flagellar hook-length control protein FliK n=1 Tax=Desulfofervidus auxilii TaxID=1621989 RepID=A0A7C2ACZ9_DESA2|nr:flagellar hook-length control protein FliK [Candidatus Desulfofervidus auxilii]
MKESVGGLLFLAKPKGCLRSNNLKRLHKKSFSKLLGTLYAIPLMNLVNQLKIKYRNHSHIYSSEGRLLSEQVANLLKGLKSELGLKKEAAEIKQPLTQKVVLGEDLTKAPGFKDLEQIIKGIEDGSISEKRIVNLLKGLKSELGLKKEAAEIKQPLTQKVVLGEDLTKAPGFKDLEQIIKGIEDGSISEKRIVNLLKGLKSELGLKREATEIKQPLASKVVLGQNLTITQVEASSPTSRQQQNTGDIIYKIIHFIEKNINSLVYKGHEHIKIETEPPNLGVIDIELKVKGKHLSAIFFTRSFEVKQILESNIHQLKQAFLNKGIELSNFQISVADHSMSWFRKEYSEGSKSGERQFFRKGKIVSHPRNLEQKWIRANYGNIDVFI